jgi:hypothetical protein
LQPSALLVVTTTGLANSQAVFCWREGLWRHREPGQTVPIYLHDISTACAKPVSLPTVNVVVPVSSGVIRCARDQRRGGPGMAQHAPARPGGEAVR